MKVSNEILHELASISPTLATIDKVNVFRVPEEYFDDLSRRILISAFLNQHSKKQAGDVPEGYFGGLSNKILFRIKDTDTAVSAEDETKNISPLLHSVKGRKVFNVPEGYFDILGEQVLNKIKPESAKVISLHSGKKWLKYAAAAMIAILVGIGALQLFNSKDARDRNSTAQLSKKYFENMPAYMQEAVQYKTPEQLDKGFASLGDDEIATYLEHHGNILDNYLLTKDIDTEKLPDATEYLIDENTLNNFLNQIDAQALNENNEVK